MQQLLNTHVTCTQNNKFVYKRNILYKQGSETKL